MKIAFIGLGNMGLPMALNLLKAGHLVTGFDLVKSQLDLFAALGGAIAPDAKTAAKDAEVLISMLPASKHVEGLYLGEEGLLASANPKTLPVSVPGQCSNTAIFSINLQNSCELVVGGIPRKSRSAAGYVQTP